MDQIRRRGRSATWCQIPSELYTYFSPYWQIAIVLLLVWKHSLTSNNSAAAAGPTFPSGVEHASTYHLLRLDIFTWPSSQCYVWKQGAADTKFHQQKWVVIFHHTTKVNPDWTVAAAAAAGVCRAVLHFCSSSTTQFQCTYFTMVFRRGESEKKSERTNSAVWILPSSQVCYYFLLIFANQSIRQTTCARSRTTDRPT